MIASLVITLVLLGAAIISQALEVKASETHEAVIGLVLTTCAWFFILGMLIHYTTTIIPILNLGR